MKWHLTSNRHIKIQTNEIQIIKPKLTTVLVKQKKPNEIDNNEIKRKIVPKVKIYIKTNGHNLI